MRSLVIFCAGIVVGIALVLVRYIWQQRATHLHLKTGHHYRYIMNATFEKDMSRVVVYDDERGRAWVRSEKEFLEPGRFSPLWVGWKSSLQGE